MTEHVCPDPAVLAAFAEGVLPPQQRAAVERHVANCPECPAIVGEVTRFLAEEAEEEAAPARPRYRWWYVAAVITAICIPVIVWRTMSTPDPLTAVRQLAASSPERTFEGRLHGFAHARFAPQRSDQPQSVPLRLQTEARDLAQRRRSADVLHARGIVALMSGKPDEAAALLRDATSSAADDPAIWNDLAVAEFERANRGVHAALALALAAANQAVTLAPSSPDAHYNRGLALERIGNTDEAVKAYQLALEHEPSPQWQAEIGERLQRIENAR